MNILSVFCNEKGIFGNPVGIIIDTDKSISSSNRQIMAKKSGFSEIVFVNNLEEINISIFSPQREIPFAGHAVVGCSFFLHNKLSLDVSKLTSMGKIITSKRDNELTWVTGDIKILPPWNFEQIDTISKLEKITPQSASKKQHTVCWSWIDQKNGVIRARTFANDWGIPEDEANGSGAMKLAHRLNREITVQHGKGSVIHAKPHGKLKAEVGGLVKLIE